MIDAIYNEKPIPEELKTRIEYLEEMGIIKRTDIEIKYGTNAEEIRDKDGTNSVQIRYKY